MLNKIGLIGGGFIGGVLTQEIAQRRLAREVGLSDPAPFVNPDDPPERCRPDSLLREETFGSVEEALPGAVLGGVGVGHARPSPNQTFE